MSHPTPDAAHSWEQPDVVLAGPVPLDGQEVEPPMWAQPPGGAALVPTAAPPPETRSHRVVEALFGRTPGPGRIARDLSLWVGVVLLGLLLRAHWWAILAAAWGALIAVVNLIRWLRRRP